MVFLGVDVGGTKTEAVLADEMGKVLSVYRGGPANHESVGLEGMLNELRRVLNGVLEKAKADLKDVDYAFFGMAGVDHREDYETLEPVLKKLGLKSFSFDNDGRIALRAVSWDGVGVIVNCGTGSVSYAYDGKRVSRIGGFSWTFGERLGSYYIAGLVISAVVRAKDGRDDKTVLIDLLEETTGTDVEKLRLKARFGLRELSEYVPSIIERLYEAYDSHDYVATKIILSVVEEILRIVRAHVARLNFSKPITLALVGSFFKNSPPLLREMISSALGPDYKVIVPKHDPVVGAVLMAMEKRGLKVSKGIFKKLVEDYMRFKRGEKR